MSAIFRSGNFFSVGFFGVLLLAWPGLIFSARGRCQYKMPSEILAGIETLDRYLASHTGQNEIEDISLAVVSNRETIFVKGYGPGVTPQTRFMAASISKSVAALAVLKTASQGLINLDLPVQNYVVEPYLPPGDWNAAVTLRTILNHSSGLPNDPMGQDRILRFQPGTRFLYSGGGFKLLQAAVENHLAQPFERYMGDFLHSLDMDQSTFALEVQGQRLVNAAFSLVSTPSDLAKFFVRVAFPSDDLRAATRDLVTPAIAVTSELSWGLGLGVYDCDAHPVLWHWGNNLGTNHALAVMVPSLGTGVIVMVRGRKGPEILRPVVQLAIGGPEYRYWDDVEP